MEAAKPRWENETWTALHPNPVACRTCIFRATAGEGYILDRATTDTCTIYEAPERKPDDVYWHGAGCENYEAADDKPQSLLLGIAVADALGVPVEFKKRGTFHVTKMVGYGTYDQPPGTWSDDTSMTLALAENMGPTKIYMEDLAKSFIAWRDEAAYTPHGETFDIGNATNRAIERMKKGVEPTRAGGKEEKDNGNGSLMRVAPLALYFFGKPDARQRYQITKDVSSMTHAHPWSVTACFIYLEMLNLLRKGRGKKAAYAELKQEFAFYTFLDKAALAKFDRILQGDIAALPENEISSTGFVVDTLEAAFWSFLTTKSYKDAVLRAVNLGDDTDTTGAVTGALAGLHYGLKDIPQEWLDTLVKREDIRDIAIKMPRWDLLPD